jgi:hypothetical protein
MSKLNRFNYFRTHSEEELLNEIYDTIDKLGLNPIPDYGIYDDDDLIAFALRYLLNNIDHALENSSDEEGLTDEEIFPRTLE